MIVFYFNSAIYFEFTLVNDCGLRSKCMLVIGGLPKGARAAMAGVCILPTPTAGTMALIDAAARVGWSIWRPGRSYRGAGVMLDGLCRPGRVQADLFAPAGEGRRAALMAAMDAVNREMGAGTVRVASAGTAARKSAWAQAPSRVTPRYTTRWDDLPVAQA